MWRTAKKGRDSDISQATYDVYDGSPAIWPYTTRIYILYDCGLKRVLYDCVQNNWVQSPIRALRRQNGIGNKPGTVSPGQFYYVQSTSLVASPY